MNLELNENFVNKDIECQKLLGDFQILLSRKREEFHQDPTEEKVKELNKICFILNYTYNEIVNRKELGIQ